MDLLQAQINEKRRAQEKPLTGVAPRGKRGPTGKA
jgi:hypothetical protein